MLKLLFSSIGRLIYPDSPTEIERKYVVEKNFLETNHQEGLLDLADYQHYSNVRASYLRYRQQVEFMTQDTICRYTGIFDAFEQKKLTLDQLKEHDLLNNAYGMHAFNEGIADYYDLRELDLLYSTRTEYIKFCDSVKQLREYQQSKNSHKVEPIGVASVAEDVKISGKFKNK